MKNISYERVVLSVLLGVSAAGLGSYAITIAALGVIALDGFKFYILNKKQYEATKDELLQMQNKLTAIEKTVTEKVSLMDNKLAAMGLSRRNA